MKSPKILSLDKKINEALEALSSGGKAQKMAKLIMADEEIQATQEYGNNVSIVRIGYNDHGPVHMHCVALNAIIMLDLLRQSEIKTSLEKEGVGSFEDSLVAVISAALLHDLGMSVCRQDHELHSANLSTPILTRLLSQVYPDSLKKRVMIRSLTLEGISGHMGNKTIHSLEAGVVQVADGCDMTKGRARIPIAIHSATKGSIHKYSANSIEEVQIIRGQEKPIRIEVQMSNEVGIFQIEEVLMPKIDASTAKPYIELYAQVRDEAPKRYL